MVDVNKLKGEIVAKGYNIDEVCVATKISKDTLYRRLRQQGDSFLIKEVVALATFLEFDYKKINDIFFNQIIA